MFLMPASIHRQIRLDLGIEVPKPFEYKVMIEILDYVTAPLSAELSPSGCILRQILDRSDQGFTVFDRHENARFIVFNNFPAATNVGRDHRQFHRGRLHA